MWAITTWVPSVTRAVIVVAMPERWTSASMPRVRLSLARSIPSVRIAAGSCPWRWRASAATTYAAVAEATSPAAAPPTPSATTAT